MRKTEVYSWRLTTVTKNAIENEARKERTTVAALLNRITKEWIDSRSDEASDEAEQQRLHSRVRKTLGTISGGHRKRAERARVAVRNRLIRRYGR